MNIDSFFINPQKSALIVIDIQDRLFQAMKQKMQDMIIRNTGILLEISKTFSIPVIVSEQYKKGLGETLPVLVERIEKFNPHEKLYFDCLKDDGLYNAIDEADTDTFIIAGIESHVCVFQTALSLIKKGKNVIVVSDAVASRRKHDWQMAMEALRSAGVNIFPTETVSFLILEKAGTPEFKKIAPLFK